MSSAAALLAEAERLPVSGWDLTILGDRLVLDGPPWNFEAMAASSLSEAHRALDMGTGGGEWLAALPGRPAGMVATESWPPNVPVAADRLRAHGVAVVHSEGAADNVDQDHGGRPTGRLPFRAGAFDVVLNRHEAFVAEEVAAVVRPGGVFLTQQADAAGASLSALLDVAPSTAPSFDLATATRQILAAGFTIEDGAEGSARLRFADIGALAWYLRMVPWAVPGFTVDRHRSQLSRLHGRELAVDAYRFWVRARR